MTSRPLMRVSAVATYLGQSPDWVRLRLADGTIPGGRKVKGRWMVAQADVDAWIDAGRPARVEPDGEPYAPFPRALSVTVRRDAA